MTIGMLWHDNDPKASLDAKLQRALAYYRKKYGQEPNKVVIHPRMAPPKLPEVPGVVIETSREILPNHFWIGVNDE